MSMRARNRRHRTICEVLRQANDLVQGHNERDAAVRDLLAEAEHMAKRMIRKLKEYSQTADAGWWEAHPEYAKQVDRQLKTYLVGKPPPPETDNTKET